MTAPKRMAGGWVGELGEAKIVSRGPAVSGRARKLNSRTVLVATRPPRYQFSVALACLHIIGDHCKLGASELLFDPDGNIVVGAATAIHG
jgi:hypothetical protein